MFLGGIYHIYLQFSPKQQRKQMKTALTELPYGLHVK
jgi:hypothetical protein